MVSQPFSNYDKQVFILNIENPIDRGALLSRYSRTSNLDIRELYRKEFESNPNRGKDFYERVFLEYGDESVAELVTAQLAIQDVSNILSKIIEESRIGLSFLEKSSRYVSYDKLRNGKYLYLPIEKTGIDLSFESKYNDIMDKLFHLYSSWINPVREQLKKDMPKESFNGEWDKEKEKAYETAIRSRAFDDVRAILPASTLTNIGISGNLRSFIYLIQRLNSSNEVEAKEIGRALYEELLQQFPELIRSASSKYSGQNEEYMGKIKTTCIAKESILETGKNRVKLLSTNATDVQSIKNLFQFRNNEFSSLEEMYNFYGKLRNSRRNKLPREFEHIWAQYEIVTNYGAFREFQRHRFMSIIRPNLDLSLGYHIPEYIAKTEGLMLSYREIMQEIKEFYDEIKIKSGSNAAQYILPMGTLYKMVVSTNLRELVYFSELRSTPQSHPDLRELSIGMVQHFLDKVPESSSIFNFVDRNLYTLGRFDQEYRKEKKLQNLNGVE